MIHAAFANTEFWVQKLRGYYQKSSLEHTIRSMIGEDELNKTAFLPSLVEIWIER
jgi:hypothetical protein